MKTIAQFVSEDRQQVIENNLKEIEKNIRDRFFKGEYELTVTSKKVRQDIVDDIVHEIRKSGYGVEFIKNGFKITWGCF